MHGLAEWNRTRMFRIYHSHLQMYQLDTKLLCASRFKSLLSVSRVVACVLIVLAIA